MRNRLKIFILKRSNSNIFAWSIIITIFLIPFSYESIIQYYEDFNNLNTFFLVCGGSFILIVPFYFLQSRLEQKSPLIIYGIVLLIYGLLLFAFLISFIVIIGSIIIIWLLGLFLAIIFKTVVSIFW